MNYITKISNFGVRLTGRHEFLRVSSHVINNSRSSSDDVQFLSKFDPANLRRGRGGRSSFSGVVATVFGASGFLGKLICNRLGKTGTQLILPYRGDHYFVRHLKLMGDLGQILFLPFHLCDEDSIRKAVKYSDVVINLIGRDYETRNFTFHQVHVEGARRIARISKEMGVEKFIHMSALNCNIKQEGFFKPGGSKFLQTKGESEDAVKEYYPDAIIFRPSDCWGQQDRFLFYFCRYFRYQTLTRSLPLINKGEGIWKQPVFSVDVAQGIANAVFNPEAVGNTYEAVGPRRYELCELLDYFNRVMDRVDQWGYHRKNLSWAPLAQLKIKLNDYSLSKPIITYGTDKVERDGVTDTTFDLPNLENLGINLTKIEDRILYELKIFRHAGYYKLTVNDFPVPTPPKYVDP